jgi:hypothetical protein
MQIVLASEPSALDNRPDIAQSQRGRRPSLKAALADEFEPGFTDR